MSPFQGSHQESRKSSCHARPVGLLISSLLLCNSMCQKRDALQGPVYCEMHSDVSLLLLADRLWLRIGASVLITRRVAVRLIEATMLKVWLWPRVRLFAENQARFCALKKNNCFLNLHSLVEIWRLRWKHGPSSGRPGKVWNKDNFWFVSKSELILYSGWIFEWIKWKETERLQVNVWKASDTWIEGTVLHFAVVVRPSPYPHPPPPHTQQLGS